MNNFNFVVMLVFQNNILLSINTVSKILQTPETDLGAASNLLNITKTNLENMRDQFNNILEEAKTIARGWNVDTNLLTKRKRKVKAFFDELSLDEPIYDPLKKFRVEVFNRSLDILIEQIKHRYEGMQHVHEIFSFLNPKILMELNENEIHERGQRLAIEYPNDICEDIRQQIINFKTIMSAELSNMSSIYELAQFLFVNNNSLLSSFSDLCTVLQLFLTLPVTSASAERTFSKLKLIKSYLRSTMTQSRLKALGVLSIENTFTENINLDDIISEFLLKRNKL